MKTWLVFVDFYVIYNFSELFPIVPNRFETLKLIILQDFSLNFLNISFKYKHFNITFYIIQEYYSK